MKHLLRSFLVAAVLLVTGARAPAAVTLMLTMVGANVTVTGSGTLNLSALTFVESDTGGISFIHPSGGLLDVGPLSNSFGVYSGISGPGSFGTGGQTNASSGTGDYVGVNPGNHYLIVPSGYVSGAALSDSATFANATFSSLGFTPGTYTYTWGSGATADSLTIIGTVPEPATWRLLIVAGTGIALAIRGRSRARSRLPGARTISARTRGHGVNRLHLGKLALSTQALLTLEDITLAIA